MGRRIDSIIKENEEVLVQVTKDPIGKKGAMTNNSSFNSIKIYCAHS